MVNTNPVVADIKLTQVAQGVKTLMEGSSTLVRVLSEKGKGHYEGLVGGVKIQFTSKNPLKVGSSFVATVTSENGKILLVPKKENSLLSNGKIIASENKAIISLLNQLGLPQNSISEHLIKQFKQLKIKFDRDSLSKIYNLALKSKTKKEKAVELLSLLKQKNIELNEDNINEFIHIWENELYGDSDENIKLINVFNGKKGSWFVYPFEIVNKSENSILGNGNIKLFFSSQENLQKVNVMCLYQQKKYYVNLELLNEKIIKVMMDIAGESIQNKEMFLNMLQSKLEKQTVEFELVDFEKLESTGCDEEEFFRVNGEL